MTVDALPPRSRSAAGRSLVRTVGSNRFVIWSVFLLTHLGLGALNLLAPGLPLGDVTLVYKMWSEQALFSDYWVGIDSLWVYPIVAIVPMIEASALGPDLYASSWLSIVMILDCVAFAAITGWFTNRSRAAVGWWWIAFLLLLGPIAVGRIDSVTVPLAILGMLLLSTRPTAAAVVLALATWIKVWPAALLAAVVIAMRQRRAVVVAAAGTSVVIVAVVAAFGGGRTVFSFVTEQTGRGLQVEAPVSTVWLWLARAGVPGTSVYYDRDILTYQIHGPGVEVAAALMNPLLALAALAVGALGVWAVRRGAASPAVLAPLALALVCTLIAFNKVGSPQFMSWLAVPVIVGLTTATAAVRAPFRVPAVLALALAALTQLGYPYLYTRLLSLEPALLVVLSARNLLVFVLLAWSIGALVALGRRGGGAALADRRSHEAARPAGS
ncbi:MAG: hypothetical protein JWM51_1875 [Microbacteriaceae bacterium]|nr:hypothetical protein [Microbacteriaceae bacterium]